MNTRVLIAQIAHQSRVTLVHTLRPLVAERVAAAIARAMLEHLAQRFAARSRKVGPHRVIERRISQSVLAVNPLLARREAVRHHCDAAAIHTHIVKIGTAIGNVDAFIDQSMLEQIQNQLRLALGLIFQMVHNPVSGCIYRAFQVLLEKRPQAFRARRNA